MPAPVSLHTSQFASPPPYTCSKINEDEPGDGGAVSRYRSGCDCQIEELTVPSQFASFDSFDTRRPSDTNRCLPEDRGKVCPAPEATPFREHEF
jgi:hypothetical protein